MISDKEVIQALIGRWIDQTTARYPMLSNLSPYLTNYICSYLEPYLDAFSNEGRIDTMQATAFAAEEVENRIKEFKARYEQK